jgi:hypothetical protein
MPREAKPFVFVLMDAEIAELQEPSGEGGHQNIHKMILDQLADGKKTVTLNDNQLGQLIRYMTAYGSGGFQGRLHRAFVRSIYGLLAVPSSRPDMLR